MVCGGFNILILPCSMEAIINIFPNIPIKGKIYFVNRYKYLLAMKFFEKVETLF